MSRMFDISDISHVKKICNLILNGQAPWQRNGNNHLPYNLSNHNYFGTFHTMVMLAKEAENKYIRSCWVNANDLRDSVYKIKSSERPTSISEPKYLQPKRSLNGESSNKVVISDYPEIGSQKYYNVEQCDISIFNRIMHSNELSPSEIKLKQKEALSNLSKANPFALERFSRKDFLNYNDGLKTYDERYLQGHFSEEYDPRYQGIDYYMSQYLYVLANVMIESRICAELGLEYIPENPHQMLIGPESDLALVYDENIVGIIEEYPEVFIHLCDDVDAAVNHFFGRDRILDNEQSLDNARTLYTYRVDFEEDAILAFPNTLSSTLSWEMLNDSLNIKSPDIDSIVFIDYQGQNTGLEDSYSSVANADKALRELDERFAFLDEKSPIKFTAYFSKDGRVFSYSGRYDVGSNEGGILQHIKRYCNEHLNSSKYHDYVKEKEGFKGLKNNLNILSEFRSLASNIIDANYNFKLLKTLITNDREILNIQNIYKEQAAREKKIENDDLSNSRKSLLALYDYLSPDYRKRISREDLKNDTCPGLTLNIASDALNGALARMQLKKYLPVEDIRSSTMSTNEARELVKSFIGKMDLNQKAYYDEHKIPYNANTTSAEADKKIREGKATEKMLTYASTFFPRESLTNLSREELNEACKAYETLGCNRNETVSQPLYNLAVEYGLVKNGENYTYGQWAKDAKECKPMEPSKAYIERHKLQDVVASLIQKYPNMWPKESEALYCHVRKMNEERTAECKASPINDFQKAFLNNRGISTEGIKNWQEAQITVCDSLYREGIISLSDVKIVAYDTTLTLPEHLANEKAPKLRSSEEKAALIKEVKDICNDVRRAERLYRIKTSTTETNNSIMNICRKACYDHLVNTGSLVNAEKSMAAAIVCSDFNLNSFSKDSIPLVKSINGTDKSTITNSQVIAHYITNTLPDCVGKYQESMPKILKVVQDYEMSLEKVKVKEAIKEEARTQALANKNEKNKGAEI